MFKLSPVVLLAVSMISPSAWSLDCLSEANPADMSHMAWGGDVGNTRHQTRTTITAANVDELALAWVFAMDDDSPHSYPLVSEDTLYIGDTDGRLHALDRETGCTRWVYQADDEIRSAIVPGTLTINNTAVASLFFGTFEGTVFAIRADNGAPLWQMQADPHSAALITGTPLFHNDVLYVPVSSYEVIMAAMPWYGCCTFRGSVLALNATSGEIIWQTYTVADEPTPTTNNLLFPDKKGPSGAPVWSSPTLDLKRGHLLFGSGENYSDPPTEGSDAIWALDMATGAVVWRNQFTEGDAWNASCNLWIDSNCPAADGPDFDFGAPPILLPAQSMGSVQNPPVDIVLAGQKSANVFAMDASDGKLLWETRLGRGGMLGGIHWGIAANPQAGLIFVPMNDRITGEAAEPPQPGLYALDAATGATQWFSANGGHCTEDKDSCHDGLSAAIISTPELVFAGGLDGWIQAYDMRNGKALWRYDTWRTYQAVNGGEAQGGAIDVHGPLVVDNLMIVTSGYAGFGQAGGNALLVFKLPR